MNIILERSKRFCGYLVGIVFFVSGVFKLMDPVGTKLIVEEYLKFMHLDFLSFISMPAAVAVSLTESVLGAALITGLWRKITAIITLSAMCVFMLISVALLVFNPAMDCGCFGEAIHLTHMQTFVKNLVLLALCCASFFPFSALGRPKKRKYVAFSFVTAALVLFGVYSLLYIPVVDFTGYSASARLAASERHMDNAHFAGDEYEAVFIYEKDGKTREFSLDDLPDSTWTYVSTETVRKETGGWDESIVTLPVMDASGESYDYLAVSPKVMVVSVYDADGLSPRKWRALAGFLRSSADSGFRPLLLAAVSPEKGEGILSSLEQEEDADTGFLREVFYYSDYKTLVSLNRSNGGATFFADGFLVRKWAFRALPNENRVAELGKEDPTEPLLSYGTVGNLFFQAFFLFCFAVMLLL